MAARGVINPQARLLALLPGKAPLLAGVTTTNHGDGTATVTLDNGRVLRAQMPRDSTGSPIAANGVAVFVRDNRVEQKAEVLTTELTIEV